MRREKKTHQNLSAKTENEKKEFEPKKMFCQHFAKTHTHTQSIENQNEIKLINTESNIITQWNVKYKTA